MPKKILAATRRRLRNIDPLRAGKVLGHERYWTFPFLRLYLEECDEHAFHEPEAAYLLAQHAPELARRVPMGPGPESYDSESRKLAWRVRALAVWGSCCRAFGQLTQAVSAYELAQELCNRQPTMEPGVLGELKARQAVLALTSEQLEDAEELATSSIRLFESAGDRQRVADALVIRAVIFCKARDPRALGDLLEALRRIEGLDGPRSTRTYLSAMNNIGLALAVGGASPEILQQAARRVGQLRAGLSKRPLSSLKMKTFWVEGLVLCRLALFRVAERRLLQARDGFWQLGSTRNYALVSMDLACSYLLDGEPERARALLDETGARLEEGAEDPILSDLICSWQRGSLTLRDLRILRHEFDSGKKELQAEV